MLLIFLTVFAFSYLIHNGSGYVREEASKSERKSAYVGVAGGIIISSFAFVRFLELTEHIKDYREQFMPFRYKEKNWSRFSSYLADHYPAIELDEQVREIET